MYEIGKLILTIVLLGSLLFLSMFRPELKFKQSVDQLVHLDTANVILEDQQMLFILKKELNSNLDTLKKYKDSTLANKKVYSWLEKSLGDKLIVVDSISKLKNQKIFPFKENFFKLKNKQINSWIIILIILISGIVGGFARSNYNLLEDVKEGLKVLRDKSKEMQKSPDFKRDDSNPQLETKLSKLITFLDEEDTRKILNIENNYASDGKKVLVNIFFGIIAASCSLLALTAFSSKVLDFQSDIDYFIFLGWCMVGAVFAKKWLLALYSRLTTSTNS